LSGRVERQSSLPRRAQSELNDFLGGDGIFPVNPRIKEGTFGLLSAGVSWIRRTRWNITTDLLVGEGRATARLFGQIRRSFGADRGLTVRGKAGAGTRPASPQTLFRLGGVNTVRGFPYGSIRSPAFWAAQLDLAPLGGRVRPVLFLDAGQGAEISRLFSSGVLVGGGVGISLFRGLVRLDFSRAISPDPAGKVRFDLLLQGVR
jgi:hemolysin activation/secretion protein